MLDWLNALTFLQTLTRVAAVWSAFFFVGYLVEKLTGIKRLLPLIPREVSGILGLLPVTVLLSLLGLLNRTVCPLLVMLLSIPGFVLIYGRLKQTWTSSRFSLYTVFFSIFLAAIVLTNLTYASMPNLSFDDPLITYAVQPDRWLNAGGMHWLPDTAFSGFPLTYEMTAVWPASLSSDRIDQLSVLQVFQMTMLFAALFRGMRILRIRKQLRIPLSATVLFCTNLFYWGSLAKTDTAALLFCTLALASVVREITDRSIKPFSSWAFMGMALATKQTSLLVLLPFMMYGVYRLWNDSWRVKVTALSCLAVLPISFAVRTMAVTGSPTYPKYQVSFMVKDEWRLGEIPEEIRLLNDRDSILHENRHFSLLKHIGIFFTSMEGILILFAGTLFYLLIRERGKLLLLLPMMVYFAVSMIVLWPPWWGAKYTILFYPAVALICTSLFQTDRRFGIIFTAGAFATAFTVTGFIAVPVLKYPVDFRYSVARSVLQGSWDTSCNYRFPVSTAEGMTHMWMNSYLTEPSVILSLHEEKRYFCDHLIYVAWRHPATMEIYEDDNLERELSILDSLSVDYVTFYRGNPVISTMEDRLEMLDHIGSEDILVPLVRVSGDFAVYEYRH